MTANDDREFTLEDNFALRVLRRTNLAKHRRGREWFRDLMYRRDREEDETNHETPGGAALPAD